MMRATLALLLLVAACGDLGAEIPLPPLAHLPPATADVIRAAHRRAQDSGSGTALAEYGRVLFLNAEIAAAEDALVRAAGMPDVDRFVCLHVAGVAADGEDRERAAAHFREALAVRGDRTTRLRLAATLEQLGRAEEARIHYEAANDPVSSDSLLGLGRLALKQGNATEAIQLLRRAGAVDDRHIEVWVALAQAYRRAGEEHKAALVADRVPPHHQASPLPDPVLTRFLRGR